MPTPALISSSVVDLVVVGGGMAGVMAALAAKSPRTRVLIVEPSNVLGGQGTAGGVAGFCGDTARVNAPFAELVARLARHGLIEPYRPNDDRRAYDLEWCAFFLQEMVLAQGIEVLLHTRVIAAVASEGVVRELTLSTAGGLLTVTPRFVIDASGACVVPLLTGFPVVHEGANRQLPMSLYFTLWDTGRPVTPVLPDGCPRWTHDNEIPMTSLHRFPSGKVEVKMKVVGFDAADGLSRSAAEVFARRQMHALIYYLQVVGYRGRKLDTHVLASVSRGIGVREERRIIGEHVLTEVEARRAVTFPDAVAVNTYHIDFHWPDRMQRAGTGITDMLDPHHLPLRMMIPKSAKNLLVPGRGASGDQTAMSAFRVMAVVAQMGFAAGHAARQCLAHDRDLTRVDIASLQAAIEAGGQSLNLSDYGDYLRGDLFAHETIRTGGSPTDYGSLQVRQERDARFVVTWHGPGAGGAGEWHADRREKTWSVRAPAATSSGGRGTAPLGAVSAVLVDDGRHVRLRATPAGLSVALSADRGATWSDAIGLLPACSDEVTPACIATRTGLAIVYVERSGALKFWHGSVERILGETVVPASVRLDAPPDQVHETHPLRA
ncbi:FAD-dependent oxidoreductase [Horticoccus sp. 23ND18S-11]|uniref:FAD-dependent oxidoreductase n=1 Tax=Horticoccus sp. 23ND18S-11 TaxID=3391832 RepID=UPI0039C92B85